MQERPFHFEIRDNVNLFISAFDDVIIGRFNKDREELDKIEVRYVYAPKQRVIHDIEDPGKNLTLPVVAVHIDGWARDEKRVFNKIDGFYHPMGGNEYQRAQLSTTYRAPLPVDIRVNMSLLSRYMTDLEQMLQNFAVHCNPYIVVAWKVPSKYRLSPVQEIRSVIQWDGDIKYDLPLLDSTSTDKSRFIADTSFIIKGWLFHANKENPVGNIHYVTANFYNTKVLSGTGYTTYDNYRYLSGGPYSYTDGSTVITEVETVGVSGYPSITNVIHVVDNDNQINIINQNVSFPSITSVNDIVVLYGRRFLYTTNVYISSNDTTLYGTVTAVNTSSRFPTFSGAPLPSSSIDIVTDNVLRLSIPPLTSSSQFDIIIQNDIGWASTYDTMSGHFSKLT